MDLKRKLLELAKPVVERFPRVAMSYRMLRDSRKISQEPKETPRGFKLIGNKAMEQGTFEPQETEIVERLLRHVDIFVNVGANIGYYCCLALKIEKHVVAFEPIDLNLQYLYKNVEANAWASKIEIFPIALGNSVGIIKIYGGGTGASLVKGWAGTSAKHVSLVPVSTLDRILGSRFSGNRLLVLMDVEGSERLVLEGASSMLRRDPRPMWIVEISISEHQPDGIAINPNLRSTFDLFWSLGYEARTADHQLRLINREELDAVVDSGVDTLRTHNFLFLEKGKGKSLLDV